MLAVMVFCLSLVPVPARAEQGRAGLALLGVTQTDAETSFAIASGVDDGGNLYLSLGGETRSYDPDGGVRWTTEETEPSHPVIAVDPSTGQSAQARLRFDGDGNVVGTDVELLDRDGQRIWLQPATGPLAGLVLAFDDSTLVVAGIRTDIEANPPPPGQSGDRGPRRVQPDQEILGFDIASGALRWSHFVAGRGGVTLDVIAPGRYLIGTLPTDDTVRSLVHVVHATSGVMHTLQLSVAGTIAAVASADDGRWQLAVDARDFEPGVIGHLVELAPDARTELRSRPIENEPTLQNLGTAAEYGETLWFVRDVAVLGGHVYLGGATRGTPSRNAFVLQLSLDDPDAPAEGVFLQGNGRVETWSLLVHREEVLVVGTTEHDLVTDEPFGPFALRVWYARLGIVADTFPPVVTPVPDRSPEARGWYRGPVTVRWAIDDYDRDLQPPPDVVVDTEGGWQQVTSAVVCDSAGNCAQGVHRVSVDFSVPKIVSVSFDGIPGRGGWYRSAGTLVASCADSVSGVATCPSTAVEGDGVHSITATAFDVAGNQASRTDDVAIDATAPAITIDAPPSGVVMPGSPLGGSTSDATSGIDGVSVSWRHTVTGATITAAATHYCDGDTCTWDTNVPADATAGQYEVIASASDNAGWTTSATTFVLVLAT